MNAFPNMAADRLGAGVRLECGVCWHVYDPALGCDTWQIPPGTPFAALPDHWRCPGCDSEKHRFLPLAPEREGRDDGVADRVAALLAAYRRADARMRGLPVHNPALSVAALGFRPLPGAADDALVGIVITPWFMNITLIPSDPAGWRDLAEGTVVERALPSGTYAFIVGGLDGFGRVLACSLFSPMAEFPAQDVACLTAEAALGAVLDPPEPLAPPVAPPPEPPPAEPKALSRRDLFGGR